MPEKRHRTLNALVVVNTGLSACWLFGQELLVCHVNRKREKGMLKQQDMTETARVVFNEASPNRRPSGKLRRILTFHANVAS
jgi:hypothetical protein